MWITLGLILREASSKMICSDDQSSSLRVGGKSSRPSGSVLLIDPIELFPVNAQHLMPIIRPNKGNPRIYGVGTEYFFLKGAPIYHAISFVELETYKALCRHGSVQ